MIAQRHKWTDEHEIGRLMEQRDQIRAENERLRAALVKVEAVMSIVEPRSDKGEYLAALFDVREALGFDRKTGTRRVNK